MIWEGIVIIKEDLRSFSKNKDQSAHDVPF